MRSIKALLWRLNLCLMLIICFKCVNGQIDVNTTFSARMNHIFQPLEKNRIPNGMLLDYAMELTNLSNFNGAMLTDSNKVMSPEFWEIYNTLYLSRIHLNGFTIQNPSVFDSVWFTQRNYGKIVLAGLFYNYSKFKEDVIQNNLITIQNEQIFDKYVNGVWQNPYQTHKLFAISPSIEYYEGKEFQVSLPSNLWQTNASNEINNLSIDFNDGQGFRVITTGQPITLNYSDTGNKIWTYRLQLTNGQYIFSHSQIKINNSVMSACSNCRFGTTNPETIPLTADEAFQGALAKGYITIKYRDLDLGLRRPLIVVEGFDAGNFINPELKLGSPAQVDFEKNILSSASQLENLLINFPEYDIIYVDWENGTDFIQRNGYLLQTIIRWVNNHKEPLQGGGYSDNVILGLSMGGVVTRWALKDMETRLGQIHATRMFISMDAPHQGANVPIAYQHMARHLKSLYLQSSIGGFVDTYQYLTGGPLPGRILRLVDRPASRQMLINWVNDAGILDNSVHDQWQTELRNLGYPTQNNIRNIAISNGTECGTVQPFSPGATLLNINGKANTRFLGDIIGQVAFPLAGAFLGQGSFILGILPGSNEIEYEFYAKAQPSQGISQQIYKGNIYYTKNILWLIPVTVTITDRNNFSNTSVLPYDYYSGGEINTGIKLNNINFQNALVKFNLNFSHIPSFNFIPTPSALDIGLNNVALSNTDYLARYIGGAPPALPKNTPFHNFVTAFNNNQKNEQHIGFFTRNGNWLAQELNQTGNPPLNPPLVNCSDLCGLFINGSDAICDNGTFTVPLVSGAFYSWTVSNTFLINAIPNNNSITITRKRPGNASITLTVYITKAGCGTITLTKTFQFGVVPTAMAGPYDISMHTIMGVAYTNTTYYFTAGETSPYFLPQSYTWTLFPPAGNPTLYSGTQPYITFSEIGYHTLQVSKMTVCGAIVSSILIDVQENMMGFQMMTSPNPVTTNLLNVTINNESSQVQSLPPNGDMIVELYNFNSAIKLKYWNLKNHQKIFQLNLSDVPKGNYLLRVKKGIFYQTRQILVL